MGDRRLAIDDLLDDQAIRRLRDLLDDRPDAIVTIGDADGRILWLSERGARGVLGRAASELQGRPRFEHVHPADLPRLRRRFAEALAGETVQYVFRAQAADGAWHRVSTAAWAVPGPTGPLVVAITVPIDGAGGTPAR